MAKNGGGKPKKKIARTPAPARGSHAPLIVLLIFVVAVFSYYLGFRMALPRHRMHAQTATDASVGPPLPLKTAATAHKAPHQKLAALPDVPPTVAPKAVALVTSPTPSSSPHLHSVAPVVATPPAGKVAIIIDDFGNSYDEAEGFLKARIPMAISVLPQLPYSVRIAQEAKSRGKTVMLHLPMEPLSDKNPGPGTIKTDMTDSEITHLVGTNMDSVPNIIGVNNHEGSKASQDHRVMRLILEIVRARRLFYVDSMTTMDSVGPTEARRLGVRLGVRNVFLDNEEDDAKIKSQLKVLAQDAKEHGEAVGIGHVKGRTLRCILDCVDSMQAESVRFVDISELVR